MKIIVAFLLIAYPTFQLITFPNSIEDFRRKIFHACRAGASDQSATLDGRIRQEKVEEVGTAVVEVLHNGHRYRFCREMLKLEPIKESLRWGYIAMSEETTIVQQLLPLFQCALPDIAPHHLTQVLGQLLEEQSITEIVDAFFHFDQLLPEAARQCQLSSYHLPDLLQFPVALHILRRTLWHFLDHHFATFPPEDRKDAVREALAVLLEKVPQKIRHIPGALWRYAKKVAVRYLASEAHRREQIVYKLVQEPVDLHSPEAIVDARLQLECLEQWVRRQFGPDVWDMLYRKAQGWTLEEIAHFHRCSTATVYRHIQQVLEALQPQND